MSLLQAVFWDVDGTLADTELSGHRPAFNRAFSDCGLGWYWDAELYCELLRIPGGRKRIQSYAEEQGETIDEALMGRLRRSKQQHYLKLVESGAVVLRPGVGRLLLELNGAGVQQWIVTSSGEASVQALRKSLSIDMNRIFQGMVTAEDVANHKPHPAPYLRALELSGTPPDTVVVLEDSSPGLRAACAAGLRCLLTPSPWDSELERNRHQAHAVADQLGEVDQETQIFSGPPCAEGRITLGYLELLLSAPLR